MTGEHTAAAVGRRGRHSEALQETTVEKPTEQTSRGMGQGATSGLSLARHQTEYSRVVDYCDW